jgi:ankyrin repeat protein
VIESGTAKATDRDEQNIMPLHWAAINAQIATCKYLLEQGAAVDAQGGDLVAMPMQWAAQYITAKGSGLTLIFLFVQERIYLCYISLNIAQC